MSPLLLLSSLFIAGGDDVFDVVGEGIYFRCMGGGYDRVSKCSMSSVSF